MNAQYPRYNELAVTMESALHFISFIGSVYLLRDILDAPVNTPHSKLTRSENRVCV